MPASAATLTLNGHPPPARNGSASSPPQVNPSASSAHSAVSDFASFPTQDPGPKTHDPSPCLRASVVKSGLSTDNPELMLDLLTGEFLLPHIAARHNVPVATLNAWVESEEVQSLLESCRRISAWRARYMALDSIPRAIHGLLMTMEQNPGTEKARRAATSIINLAFRETPSPSGGGWSPDSVGRPGKVEDSPWRGHPRRSRSNSSAERDQCAEPQTNDWPARSARGSSRTALPNLSPAFTTSRDATAPRRERSDGSHSNTSHPTSTPPPGCDGISLDSPSSGAAAPLRESAPPLATNEQPSGLPDAAPPALRGGEPSQIWTGARSPFPDPTPSSPSANPAPLRENVPAPADRLAELEAQRADFARATRGLCGADQKRLVKQALAAMRARSRAPT